MCKGGKKGEERRKKKEEVKEKVNILNILVQVRSSGYPRGIRRPDASRSYQHRVGNHCVQVKIEDNSRHNVTYSDDIRRLQAFEINSRLLSIHLSRTCEPTFA